MPQAGCRFALPGNQRGGGPDTFEETPEARCLYGFARNWQEHFDHVPVINADLPHRTVEAPPPELELIADEGFTELYRTPHAA